jgi:EAL domain-containing protein (putative c-di-GMP-specific phosphodiesterase class I)/GGDEF domain-containing protein
LSVPALDVGERRPQGYVGFLRDLRRYLRGRQATEPCGLLVVHLCNLNRINTSAGYRTGRRLAFDLLAEVRTMLRNDDWLAPLAPDRFAVALGRVRNAGHLILAANRISQIAAEFAQSGIGNAMLEVRVGAALFPLHGNSAELLLRHGELAVETATGEKAKFAVYTDEATRKMTDDWDLEAELDPAIENGEFAMFYQPKMDARSLLPCGAEALMRWNSPRLGNVSPDRFIPIAENTSSIDALTSFALHSAARDACAWGDSRQDLTVAVNLSPTIINNGNVVAGFRHVAAIWGIDIGRFTAEVTENGVLSAGGAALRVLHDLRDAGVRVSIDDFGTGNSSLAYFKDIPADELKIDKSFIFAMLESDANRRMVKTIIDLAHGFDLKVVAEGVENAGCVEQLQQFGCDVLQGYFFSKPLPQGDLIRFLG